MTGQSDTTTVLDLGEITETLLVFGGPYSNVQATQAMLDIAKARDIPAEHVICTGDVVAYCANPLETIAAIRHSGIHVVMGNCEESLGFRLDDCGCGFEEGTDCDVLSRQWYSYTDTLLGNDDRNWLRTRPRRIVAQLGERSVAFIHGSAEDISGWVFASTDASGKMADLDALGCDAVVGGHCGLPFVQELPDGRLWLNAGVVGMPANDGTPRGWFATLEPTGKDIAISIEPLEFDEHAAAQAMRDAKLADAYAVSLETGLWPNMDVLPASERSRQGVHLTEVQHIWRLMSRNAA